MKTLVEYLVNNNIKNVEPNKLIIGDILVYDAGYNMILPHFLRITNINKTGKSCNVEELENTLISGSYNTGGKVMPNLDKQGKPIDKLFIIKHNYKGIPYIMFKKHEAYLWNHEPQTVDMSD